MAKGECVGVFQGQYFERRYQERYIPAAASIADLFSPRALQSGESAFRTETCRKFVSIRKIDKDIEERTTTELLNR
jgi:hypothetical protein